MEGECSQEKQLTTKTKSMKRFGRCGAVLLLLFSVFFAGGQTDTLRKTKRFKNVIRYNLSGAMVFGVDQYIVLGYERVLFKNQSVSLNAGLATLPKLIYVSTGLFSVTKDRVNTGYNVSLDYRFYLKKENKHQAPRGVYIGPYVAYNHFHRETIWEFQNRVKGSTVESQTNFDIGLVGFEIGYQFILWKRISLDLVMIGPGFGYYNFAASVDANLNTAERSDLFEGLEQLLKQRYPGANFVFQDKHVNANGVMRTAALGYRYLIHIGFNF
jgi:hypothetical protein